MEQHNYMSEGELHAAQVISNNIVRLLKQSDVIHTVSALAERSEVSRATLTRIIKTQNSVTIETLEPIAAALGVEVWMLLYPGLDPRNLPVFGDVGQGADPLPTDAAWLFSDEALQFVDKKPGSTVQNQS